MEKSALERYFDKYIANDAPHTEEEEEEEEEEERNEEQDEGQFFKLLPDELLTLMESGQDVKGGADLTTNTEDGGKEKRHDCEDTSKDPERSEEESLYCIPRNPDSTGNKLIPKIRNITSAVNLGCRLDLGYIAANTWNVKFNPKRFHGLSMMIRKPRATGIFYSAGQLVCMGTDSLEKSKVAARRLARIVQKLGFPVRFLKFEVYNLMASCKTHPVNLERMAAHDDCSYEPELFPALFYSVLPGMSMIVFRSGVLSLSGAKSQADVNKAFEIAQPVVNYFRK